MTVVSFRDRRHQDQALDPLALQLACSHCKEIQEPFTLAGVLYDWCPGCNREVLVPLRYADPVLAAVVAALRQESVVVDREDAFVAFLRESAA